MKRLEVSYDEWTNWNEILSWYEPLKIASNLRNYNLGENLPRDCDNSFEAFKELLKEEYGLSIRDVVYMPLYAYIHSDISFSLGSFNCIWDSGLAGFIWAEKKEYLKYIGKKRFTKKVKEQFEEEVENLVKELNCDFYIVTLYDEKGEVIDSLGGLGMEIYDEKKVYQFAKENFGIEDKKIIIEFEDYETIIYKAA